MFAAKTYAENTLKYVVTRTVSSQKTETYSGRKNLLLVSCCLTSCCLCHETFLNRQTADVVSRLFPSEEAATCKGAGPGVGLNKTPTGEKDRETGANHKMKMNTAAHHKVTSFVQKKPVLCGLWTCIKHIFHLTEHGRIFGTMGTTKRSVVEKRKRTWEEKNTRTNWEPNPSCPHNFNCTTELMISSVCHEKKKKTRKR